ATGDRRVRDPDLARPLQELQPTRLSVGSPHCLVDASPRGAAAPAWSSLRGKSKCALGRNLLRTPEHRRCGRGGGGLPAATSIAQCSFLPMGNALPSGTPEKHARRQSAADARLSPNAPATRSSTGEGT